MSDGKTRMKTLNGDIDEKSIFECGLIYCRAPGTSIMFLCRERNVSKLSH